MDRNTHYAVLAGFCAAGGSVFGKLSGLPSVEEQILLRILFFVLMLVCNANVWTLYAKALQTSESTLIATVISTATNYITSGIIGLVCFNEVTSMLWWCGIASVMSGLLLIVKNSKNSQEDLLKAQSENLKNK